MRSDGIRLNVTSLYVALKWGMKCYFLDVVSPLDRCVVPRDLDLKECRRTHVGRQFRRTLSTTAANTCTPTLTICYHSSPNHATITTTTWQSRISDFAPSAALW